MITAKRSILLITLFLAACSGAPDQSSPTPPSTQPPEVATALATTAPATETAPASTATLPSSPVGEQGQIISRYQAGDPVQIYQVGLRTLTEGWGLGRVNYLDSDHILYTTDGGNTWRDVTPPQPISEGPLLASVNFLDKDRALVIYFPQDHNILVEDPFVWRTADRGESWQAGELLDTSGLTQAFLPRQLIFAFPSGAPGSLQQDGWLSVSVGTGQNQHATALYQTSDGGQTWSRILDPFTGHSLQTCHKNAFAFADAKNGWAALDCQGSVSGPALAYTTNGGSAWGDVQLPPPPDHPALFEESANCYTHSPYRFGLDRGTVGIVCESSDQAEADLNFLYLTDDGGQTWQAKPAPLGQFSFYTWMQGYLAGSTIYSTDDRGTTWVPRADVQWFGELNFINSQVGWVVAHYQGATLLMSSRDGGATWNELSPVIGP